MSDWGHKQTSRDVRVAPALPPTADIRRINWQRIIEVRRRAWRDKPRHDYASHGSDAFRVMATRFRAIEPARRLRSRSTTA